LFIVSVAFVNSVTPLSINLKEPKSKVQLGELLFFDPILSKDNSLSCASCHKPQFAFADTLSFSIGINNQLTRRNTPSAMNLKGHEPLFYDGRAANLAEQAIGPITNPSEMGNTIQEVLNRLNAHINYAKYFKKFYKSKVTAQNLGDALASYEESLETSNTSFDRELNGKENGMAEAEKRGRKIFIGKGKCFDCHFGPDFTQDDFKNIGLYNGKDLNDKGRFDFTHKNEDIGKFKVPGLRNVAITAPYMHNGMFKTLKQVIEYYNNPDGIVSGALNRDSILNYPLHLSDNEKDDLEAFLRALTDEKFKKN
jgi:cytochrome c peroxidase